MRLAAAPRRRRHRLARPARAAAAAAPAPPPRRPAPARAPPGAAPPPRQLAPPDPRQTCDACGAPACLETDRGGGDAASYALNLRRPRRWRASHAVDAALAAMASTRRDTWVPRRRRVPLPLVRRRGVSPGRSRVIARDRIDAAAPRVEGAWQRAFARAAEAVGVEAAKRLAERQAARRVRRPSGALLDQFLVGRGGGVAAQAHAADANVRARRRRDRRDARRGPRATAGPASPAAPAARTATVGGGNLQTHKTETWGSKDAPDSAVGGVVPRVRARVADGAAAGVSRVPAAASGVLCILHVRRLAARASIDEKPLDNDRPPAPPP